MKLYYYGYYRFQVIGAVFWWCAIALFQNIVVGMIPILDFPLKLLKFIIPAYYLAYPLIIHFKRKRQLAGGIHNIISQKFEKTESKSSNNEQEQFQNCQSKSLLSSSQIEQLNELRNKVTMENAKAFPVIRLSGQSMPNLVPEAGIFTAKINRQGKIQNLVVMLSTMNAVTEFEKLCFANGSLPKEFWAEGHLLPSKAGNCYSVLLVTAFRFCGKRITF